MAHRAFELGPDEINGDRIGVLSKVSGRFCIDLV
jgi:hypothetical protein